MGYTYYLEAQQKNDVAAPLIAKRGVWHLEQTIELYNVPQSLWRINVSKYYEERAKSLGS